MKSKRGFVIPLIIIVVALLAIGGGVFVYKNKKAEAPDVNTWATSTVSTPFISVGDKLGGMTVVSINPFNTGQYTSAPSLMTLTPDNAKINLNGVITVTGMYHYLETEEGFNGYCMFGFDKNSYLQLPFLSTDDIKSFPIVFCFRNEDFVKKELGDNQEPIKVTVKINNFEINRYPAEVIDRADLIEVVSISTLPVACTMDAKICPDGSYVGRSGPDCKFVCPNN